MADQKEIRRGQLAKALKHHFAELAWARLSNKRLVATYAGTSYGKGTEDKKRSRKDCINLMLQTAEAYTVAMAANTPRFLCSTDTPELFGFSQHFMRALNALAVEIRMEQTLEEIVRDAFFLWGVSKTHLADSGEIEVEQDVWMDPGSPFVERISNDNVVFDTGAKDWRKTSLLADRYRVPLDDLRDHNRFDQRIASKIKGASKYEEDSELSGGISGYDGDADEYEAQVDLANIYLRKEGLVYTEAIDRDFGLLGSEPLAVRKWTGPEEGPYDMLSLGPVPDNVIPTSPAMNLKSLHDLSNSLFRAQDRQASRQKSLTVFETGSEGDAKKIQSAKDGEIISVARRDSVGVLNFGGADQATLGLLLQVLGLFDRMGGNVQAKLGLGAQSPTAAQDKMQLDRISRQEEAMQNRVMRFVAKLGGNLGNLTWQDPVKVIPMNVDLRMQGYKPVQSDWTPQRRKGSFKDYRFRVEPYSMAFKSPTQRLNQINELVAQFIANPQLLSDQGVALDLKELIAMNAELLNEPWVLRILKSDQTLRRAESEQGPPQGGKSERTYIRKNVPTGGTEQSQRNVMSQALLAGGSAGVNQQQTAALSVPR